MYTVSWRWGLRKEKHMTLCKFILKLWANVPVDIINHLFNHECLSMAYQYYVLIWKVQACKSKIAPEVNCCRHQNIVFKQPLQRSPAPSLASVFVIFINGLTDTFFQI